MNWPLFKHGIRDTSLCIQLVMCQMWVEILPRLSASVALSYFDENSLAHPSSRPSDDERHALAYSTNILQNATRLKTTIVATIFVGRYFATYTLTHLLT